VAILRLEVRRNRLLVVTAFDGLDSSSSSGSRDNIARDTEVLTKVVDTLLSQDVVVVLPVEGLSGKALGLKSSHDADNLQVGDIDIIGVLGLIRVLLDDNGSL
jgi:hypothetical protein